MIKRILLAGVFVLLATSAFGEYYQYTDESGNARFTDNLYEVPENQRPAVKTFESVGPVPVDAPAVSAEGAPTDDDEAAPAEDDETAPAEPDAAETSVASPDTGEKTFEMDAAELNRLQKELGETRISLEQEKSSLELQAPKDDATTNEKIAYSMQIEALNEKIQQYEKDIKTFEEKVAAFNNRKKQKETKQKE